MSQDYSWGPCWDDHIDEGETCHDGACYPLLRHCVGLCEPGYGLEFGVQTGHSLGLISRSLLAVGFDSFQGLPEDWGPFTVGAFAQEPPDVENAELVVGWFADTVPLFDFGTVEPLRLVHIDCDLYSSAKTVFDHLGPHLIPGAYVVFDEFLHDWPPNESRGGEEQRAWREFADRTRISWTVVGHSRGAWAIQVSP